MPSHHLTGTTRLRAPLPPTLPAHQAGHPALRFGRRGTGWALIAAAVTALAACGSSDDTSQSPPPRAAVGSPILKAYDSDTACADVDAAVRGQIDAALAESEAWFSYEPIPEGAVADVGSGTDSAVTAPGDGAESDSAGSGSGNWSGTTLRSEGVDEADRIKSDGQYLYQFTSASNGLVLSRVALGAEGAMTLSGQWRAADSTGGSDAAGSDSTRIAAEIAEGMYLVGDAGTEVTGAAPHAVLLSRVGRWSVSPMAGGARPQIGSSTFCWAGNCGPSRDEVLIRLVDTATAAMAVTREIRLDGRLVASRRIGNRLHVVTQSEINLPDVRATVPHDAAGAYVKALQATRAALPGWSLASILAPRTAGTEGALPAGATAADCARVLISDTPAMPAVVQVATVNLADGAVSRQSVLGRASSVMMSARGLIVATAATNWRDLTDLHRFAVQDDGTLAYEGSGRVQGVPISDHAIDDAADGSVRVATSRRETDGATSEGWPPMVTRLETFQASAAPTVWPQLGSTPALAPDESLTAVRFLGNRAYLSTAIMLRDPFFVVDLTDASAPAVLGELKIPGITTYLHPVGPNHLLGLGLNDNNANGTDFQVTLFDVTDPGKPAAQSALTLGPGWLNSEALWDRHAFTWYSPEATPAITDAGIPAGGLAGTMAVPIRSFVNGAQGWTTGLRIVGVDPSKGADGLWLLGNLDGSDLLDGTQGSAGFQTYDIRRGFFRDTTAYAISDGAIRSARITAPTPPLATIRLP